MCKLAVVHFNPIEIYPPVMNWLNYLSSQPDPPVEVRVYTLALPDKKGWFNPATSNIRVIRAGSFGKKQAWKRYLSYFFFYTRTLWDLVWWRPGRLLYFETISSLPVLFYKKYVQRHCRLLIHYHEYVTKEEYAHGMFLNRHLHRMEKKIYASADWISQCNEDRMRFFVKDQEGIVLPALHILPNYPPASWNAVVDPDRPMRQPLRVVYVGSLSLNTMYTREFADWVIRQSGEVIWDIYTNNMSEEAREFLQSAGDGCIRFCGAVDYFALPSVLKGYDVGVITYTGYIPNHEYSAPNKLFEYLSCGLDVWLSDKLTGSLPYVTSGIYPKVISLDFTDLADFDWRKAVDRTGLHRRPSPYHCEDVLQPLWRQAAVN